MKTITIASAITALGLITQAFAAAIPSPSAPLDVAAFCSDNNINPVACGNQQNPLSKRYVYEPTEAELHASSIGLECRIPGKGNLFLLDPDPAHGLLNVSFNVHVPWTVSYGGLVLQKLKRDGWHTKLMEKDSQSCVWKKVDSVSKMAVERGDISHSMREIRELKDGISQTVEVFVDAEEEALRKGGERIRKALEETFPTVEIVLILVFTTWMFYIPLACFLVWATCSACGCLFGCRVKE